MFSRFFIERPIFASVISILILSAGLVALRFLPIELYPNLSPPNISVSTAYPGASAQTVADTVAAPLEEAINGAEGMLYMSSSNSSMGAMGLTAVFDVGTDPDKARIDVQNRVDTAIPRLPEDVRREGVSVDKSTPSFVMVIAVFSPTGRYDPIYTSNFASLTIADELRRLNGISQVNVIGARDYSMRIWLKPDQMAEIGLTTSDVVKAIRAQNTAYPIGELGAPPNAGYIELTVPVVTTGRLTEPSEYENIILRSNKNGAVLRIKDIGRVELGAQGYDVKSALNGTPTTLIAIYQQYDANALHVSRDVRNAMARISKTFPVGIEYSIPYDVTFFVKTSIKEVFWTVFQACILVTFVVFFFLQNWRVALIPMIAMIVSIIGTFAGMYLLNFSINILTLFGLVLTIGIVVDDAIVVVENVERNMREGGLTAKEAAIKAMKEVTGPVIAIVCVLCAVFIPVAFLGGIAGILYKQFAFTITISVIISGIVALTLSPALSALLLVHSHKETKFSQSFHSFFNRFTAIYLKGATWLIEHTVIACVIFAFVIGGIVAAYHIVPKSFVPKEDQGYFISAAVLPDAASLQRTEVVTKQFTDIALKNPAVKDVFTMTGFSVLEGTQRTNTATFFPVLKDWKERKKSNESVANVIQQITEATGDIPTAKIISMAPPSIRGLSSLGGFQGWVVNRTTGGMGTLEVATNDLVAAVSKRKEVTGVNSQINAESLQVTVNLDKAKAIAYEVAISDVFDTLQSVFGTLYVNDFNKYGRVFRVILQADPQYRSTVGDIERIYVRSTKGEMIPLSALVSVEFTKAPMLITRFNGFPAAQINGSAAHGFSSGDAISALEETAYDILPEGMALSWSGEAFQELKSGGTSFVVLFGGLFVVFFILAALYEKWALPIAILLAVPFGIFGAFLAIWLRDLSNDVYFQIGLVALIGLAAKNAILIVEFANIKRKEGRGIKEAALEAARLRFRAIIMTSLTFIVGVIPLVISTGAGSASRHSVGTGVMGGMIVATFLGVFFVPLFYCWFHGKIDEENEV